MPIPNLDHALPVAQHSIDTAVQSTLNCQFNVDLAIEHLVRDLLRDWDSTVGFAGEEHGTSGNQNTYWVLDPIDSTGTC